MRRPRSEPPEVEIGLDPAWAAEETERPRLETVAAGEAAPVGAVERGPRRRATRSEARGRPRASLALMSAVPHGVLAACAFLPVVMPFPRAGGLPLAAPLVLMAQLGGLTGMGPAGGKKGKRGVMSRMPGQIGQIGQMRDMMQQAQESGMDMSQLGGMGGLPGMGGDPRELEALMSGQQQLGPLNQRQPSRKAQKGPSHTKPQRPSGGKRKKKR